MPDSPRIPPTRRQKLREIASGCRAAARRYRTSSVRVLLRLARLYAVERIPPREALRTGVAHPALSSANLLGCVSKHELVELQRRVNPDDLFWLTGDKGMFYSLCDAMGLPVPKTYAVFRRKGGQPPGRPTQVVAADGPPQSHRQDWEDFFREGLPVEFVIKPARAGRGRGVMVLTRRASGFANGKSGRCTAADLYDHMMQDPVAGDFVIQERLVNHPDIVQLTGSTYLQTARLTTFVDDRARAAVHYVNFKLIASDNVIDNFRHGTTGNLIANVSSDSGMLGHGIMAAPDGIGGLEVRIHPKTGHPIEGFRLPWWDAALELARQAAEFFRPVRSVGWDIALTPSGPVLLEGNHFWDPCSMIAIGAQAPGASRHGMDVTLELLRDAMKSAARPTSSSRAEARLRQHTVDGSVE